MTPPLHEDILRTFQTLPPLPTAVTRLLHLINQPETNMQEVARTILLDQALTARVLRIANSPFYGFSQKIRTVQQATVVLGRYALRNIALGMAVSDLHRSLRHDDVLDHIDFWRHSVGVACGALSLARTLKIAQQDDAFVAGLLHDVGKMILVAHMGPEYATILKQAEATATPLHLYEQERLHTDHAAIGALLCQYWGLPDMLTHAIGHHHRADTSDPASLSSLVHAANALVKLAGIGDSGSPLIDRLDSLPASYQEPLPALLHHLPHEISQVEQLLFEDSEPSGDRPGTPKRVPLLLRVPAVDRRQALALALCARGYEPSLDPADPTLLTAQPVASDAASQPDALPLDLTSERVPVSSGASFNARHLHTWLDQVLTRHAPASL